MSKKTMNELINGLNQEIINLQAVLADVRKEKEQAINERDALAAQVEVYRKHISNYGEISSGFDAAMWESKGREILKNALQVTSQQCLAEIRAQAVLQFAGSVLTKYRYDITEWAKIEADKIRQGGVK